MILDVTYFGYGVGLVMVGWVSGLAVGVVFRVVRSIY